METEMVKAIIKVRVSHRKNNMFTNTENMFKAQIC